MTGRAPLQLLLFHHSEDRGFQAYEDAIVRAFQGGKESAGYLATGDDMGIDLRVFSSTVPPGTAESELDEFCHTLTIVLIDRRAILDGDDALWDWLGACAEHVRDSDGRHAALFVSMDERAARDFGAKRPALGTLQRLIVTEFGEEAIRPALLALLTLHRCREILAKGCPSLSSECQAGFLRLFISHAKADGLPLALALKNQIDTLKWLSTFYDASDLPPGSDWQRELERGVGSSLIVMLRTEIYDTRHWCQQEVLWADEYAVPAVLVDARTNLNHAAARLPFDRVPVVRIPDGNLLRVLSIALREGVRFLHFARRIEEMKRVGDLPSPVELRVFSFAPSMAALLRACTAFTAAPANPAVARLILYPDPPLGRGLYEAAEALVDVRAPGAKLATPNTLAATGADAA